MENEENRSYRVIAEANSITLDYFTQIYIHNLESLQGLKTELFELNIQIETLEKTKSLYTNHVDHRRDVFSAVAKNDDASAEKESQLALKIEDLKEEQKLLEQRIANLESDISFYKKQTKLLSRAQKYIHILFDPGEDTDDNMEDAFEFIEEADTTNNTAHNYSLLMLEDYANYRLAAFLDQRVRQELETDFNKLDGLKWMLLSDPDRAKVTLDELSSSQRTILHSLDNVLDRMYYNMDAKRPIKEQIERLITKYQKQHSDCMLVFTCDCTDTDTNFPRFINLRLIQMLKEIFDNIFEHANATEVIAKISISNRLIDVAIHDNGIGIPEDYLDRAEWYSGLHLLHEIIYQLDGNLQIHGDLVAGTDVRFSFPVRY